MPNPLQVSNMFAQMMPDPKADRQNMLGDVQALESMRGIKNQNMLSQILAENPDYGNAASAYLEQGGDANTALKLRGLAQGEEDRALAAEDRTLAAEDRARALAGDFEEVMGKVHTLTPQTYGAWAARARKIAEAAGQDPADIPEAYDEAFIMEAREAMKQASRPTLEQVGGRDALYDPSKNAWSLEKPSTRSTWNTLSSEQAQAMGLPEGGTYRMSSDGRVEPITRPPSEKNPAKVQIMDVLLQRGIATDPKEAWSMANQAVQNPTAGAAAMARAEMKAQEAAYIMPDKKEYQSLEDFYKKWLGIIDSSAGPTGAGTLESPAQPMDDAAYELLPSGAYFIDPEDGKTYRKP